MTFGRKGAELDTGRGSLEGFANPAPARRWTAHVEADEDYDEYEEVGESLSRKMRLAVIGVSILLGVLTLDALAAGTSMITPLPDGASFYASVTGAALGLLIGGYLWLTKPGMRGIRITIGMLIGFPLFIGAWANMMLWRAVEHVHFDFSDAKWEQAAYPVEYFSTPSRRSFGFDRYSVEIDPFDVGGNTDIPLPEWQWQMYYLHRDSLCVVVEQRKSKGGHIQVKTDGSLKWSEPEPVQFVPCR